MSLPPGPGSRRAGVIRTVILETGTSDPPARRTLPDHRRYFAQFCHSVSRILPGTFCGHTCPFSVNHAPEQWEFPAGKNKHGLQLDLSALRTPPKISPGATNSSKALLLEKMVLENIQQENRKDLRYSFT